MYLIGKGTVITFDETTPLISNGGVIVDGDSIAEVGKYDELLEKYPNAKVIASDVGIIMPGLIDLHAHSRSVLDIAPVVNQRLNHELIYLIEQKRKEIERKLTNEQLVFLGYAAAIDCIKNGITTLFDHHSSMNCITGSLRMISMAYRDIGIRACLSYETCAESGSARFNKAFAENIEFAQYCRDLGSKKLTTLFGLRSGAALDETELLNCSEAAEKVPGFHVHSPLNDAEMIETIRHFHALPEERLLKHGLLGKKSIYAGSISHEPQVLNVLKQSGCIAVLSAQADKLQNTSGASLSKLTESGITAGIGTDHAQFDMLGAAREEFCRSIAAGALYNTAFNDAARALWHTNSDFASENFGIQLGKLKAGYAADIIILEHRDCEQLTEQNYKQYLLFRASPRDCVTSMVGGKLIMENRRLLTVNEKLLYKQTVLAFTTQERINEVN